jgi:hypothetical protein
MRLSTPRSSGLLWAAGVALWFGILPVLIYDGRRYYAEGGQSLDGPGMLFAGAAIASVMLLPVFLAVLACYLLRYRGPASVLRFRTRSLAAILLSAVALLASAFFLWCILWRVRFWEVTRIPYVAYLLAWSIYFQYLRAAAVNRHDAGPTATDFGDVSG